MLDLELVTERRLGEAFAFGASERREARPCVCVNVRGRTCTPSLRSAAPSERNSLLRLCEGPISDDRRRRGPEAVP